MEVVTQAQWPSFCRGQRKPCRLLRGGDGKIVRSREGGAAGLASPEAGRMVPTRFWESKKCGIGGKRCPQISFLFPSPGLLRRN